MSEVKDKCPKVKTIEEISLEYWGAYSNGLMSFQNVIRNVVEAERARIAELEAALKPFAEAGIFDWVKDDEAVSIAFNAKVWRNASRALASTEKGEG